MRRVAIDDVAIGAAVLGRDIRSPAGDVLARAGLRLTPRIARALREHGVAVCFIEDAAGVGIDVAPLVEADGADQPAARALRDVCELVAPAVEEARRHPTMHAIEALRDLRLVNRLDTTGTLERLRAAANDLAQRAVTLDPAFGFLTERQASDDVVGHSLGVAALAARLGAHLGFSPGDVATTALAALCHDLGLLLVPEEVRRTPVAQRTPGQQRRYEDHTLLGHALLRPLERRAPALSLVAAEHHEEQAGGGFPHGVTGGNRILRSAGEGPGSSQGHRRLALVSEIVSVADRYERLVSPAPGEPARSAAAARRTLATEAGARLNLEVVGRFMDLLPPWPVGTEVTLHGPAIEGARAVVAALDPARRDRPRVRVFAQANAPTPAYDLDLRTAPDVTLSTPDAVAAA